MPVVIEEFEVVAEPPSSASGQRGVSSGASQAPPDARPAQLQTAVEQWRTLAQERALRVDDR
jgi:hypothetical protein